MSSPVLLGRPPERTERIVRELRGRITQGELAPGVQLPTRAEIEQQFGASSGTVNRALQELQRDGFVTVNGRLGTFVSKTPPHLTNYALVFPTVPGEMNWNRFFAALNHECHAVARAKGRQITAYYGADSHLAHGDYNRLMADVKAHRLGGIIFASLPGLLKGTPMVDEQGTPRVAIMAPSPDYAMPQIHLESETMWHQCADLLLAQGRRNLGLLLPPLTGSEMEAIRQKMVQRGFNVPTQWVQGAPREFPEIARNITQLLFEAGRNRPDAFFIADDNLVEHALEGLIAAGVKVPHEVEVITHCNFPHLVPATVPVRRLGFDARQVLNACFDNLEDQRSGQQVARFTMISAQFEDEMT